MTLLIEHWRVSTIRNPKPRQIFSYIARNRWK